MDLSGLEKTRRVVAPDFPERERADEFKHTVKTAVTECSIQFTTEWKFPVNDRLSSGRSTVCDMILSHASKNRTETA